MSKASPPSSAKRRNPFVYQVDSVFIGVQKKRGAMLVAIPSYIRSIQSYRHASSTEIYSARRNPFVYQVDSVAYGFLRKENNRLNRRNPFVYQVDSVMGGCFEIYFIRHYVAIPSYIRSIQSSKEAIEYLESQIPVAIPSYIRSIQSGNRCERYCEVADASQSLRISGRFSLK